ncbi:MAG: hypothetical protein QME79_13280 [Bacillota bacterium]|nr:hypothetical protein [Bacillota bacterium]
MRQSFLNGALTRLADPDTVLRRKIAEFVAAGDFGLASGAKPGGGYDRVWYAEAVGQEEIVFDSDVYLLQKDRAKALKATAQTGTGAAGVAGGPPPVIEIQPGREGEADRRESQSAAQTEKGQSDNSSQPTITTLRLAGTIPPEIWNRLGTRLIPKLRSAGELSIQINVVSQVDGALAPGLGTELRQILEELGLGETLKVSWS